MSNSKQSISQILWNAFALKLICNFFEDKQDWLYKGNSVWKNY